MSCQLRVKLAVSSLSTGILSTLNFCESIGSGAETHNLSHCKWAESAISIELTWLLMLLVLCILFSRCIFLNLFFVILSGWGKRGWQASGWSQCRIQTWQSTPPRGGTTSSRELWEISRDYRWQGERGSYTGCWEVWRGKGKGGEMGWWIRNSHKLKKYRLHTSVICLLNQGDLTPHIMPACEKDATNAYKLGAWSQHCHSVQVVILRDFNKSPKMFKQMHTNFGVWNQCWHGM